MIIAERLSPVRIHPEPATAPPKPKELHPKADESKNEIPVNTTPKPSSDLSHLIFSSNNEPSDKWQPVSDARRAEVIEERRRDEEIAALKYLQASLS